MTFRPGDADREVERNRQIEEQQAAAERQRATEAGRTRAGSKTQKDAGTATPRSVLERLLKGDPTAVTTPYYSGGGGGITDDRIMFTDATGHSWTWGDLKSKYVGPSGSYVGRWDEDGNHLGNLSFDSGMTLTEWQSGAWDQLLKDDIFWTEGKETDLTGIPRGSGSGSGSRGAAAAVYQAPPRAALTDAVRQYVINVTGTDHQQIIKDATDVLAAADRQAWGGAAIDPTTAMKEHVRKTAEYKVLHAGRAASEDELTWVTQPIAKLRSLGLSSAQRR